jgi:2',3'-cyclic-nucleotide 2'-phosphodiesterase (5'-nucleotidase family)
MKHGLILAFLGLFLASSAAADVIDVEILYTSDIHGHIGHDEATFLNPNFPPPLGGGASATAYIQRVREEAAALGRTVYLFDSGDLFQGTPVGMRTEGTAIVKWMNSADYTAGCLGNHDFDKGWENAARLVELANFPLMASNVINAETGETVPWVPGDTILETDGVRIAVLGYCTETTSNMSFAKNIAGLDFVPIHEKLLDDVPRVRSEGADLVFVLMHAGLPYKPEREREYRRMREREEAGELPHWGMNAMEIAYTIPGIDCIFAGHTHQGYDNPWSDPRNHTIVFEPYANGSSIGHVTLHIDRETKTLLGYSTHAARGALVTLFEEEIWPEVMMAEVIASEVAEAEVGLDEVIGYTDVTLSRGSPTNALMGFVVADAYRETLGADFALQNTGGVRANISIGPITERDLIQVSPFGNQMVTIQMKGSLIRSLIEDKLRGSGRGGIFVSGGKVRFDVSRPDGDRIVDFSIGGEPLDPERVYKVAITDYLAQGNSGLYRLRDETNPEDFNYTGFQDIDCLREYVRTKGTLNPKNDGRWVKVESSS